MAYKSSGLLLLLSIDFRMEPHLSLLSWISVKVGFFLGSPQQVVSEFRFRMTSIMKVDIQKFDREIGFNIWKVHMRAVLIQHGLWKVLSGLYTKPEKITDEQLAADQKKRRRLLADEEWEELCLLYTSPSPRDGLLSRMPSSA